MFNDIENFSLVIYMYVNTYAHCIDQLLRRTTYVSDTLRDFTIHVGDSLAVVDNPICASHTTPPIGRGATVTFECAGTGRYVGILRWPGGPRPDLLTVCEVVIMAHPTQSMQFI